MFRERRKMKRIFERNRKTAQGPTFYLLEGSALLAGGIASLIYFITDLSTEYVELFSLLVLAVSLISAATGYNLLKKGLRQRE
jgi:Na+/H+ antiporter NhaA